MCDYSLDFVASRPAKVGDKPITTKFEKFYYSWVCSNQRAKRRGVCSSGNGDRI